VSRNQRHARLDFFTEGWISSLKKAVDHHPVRFIRHLDSAAALLYRTERNMNIGAPA
jgi:hypothetical protein